MWKVNQWLLHAWRVFVLAIKKYIATDGELRAASFAYYAFFALFPLLLLFISIGGWLLQGNEAEAGAKVLGMIDHYVPVQDDGQNLIASTVRGVISSRGTAGIVALFALIWSSLRFFQALVQGVNRAWGVEEYPWWRLPIANLLMVGITASTLLLGVIVPLILKAVEEYWQQVGVIGLEMVQYSVKMARLTLPSIILFYGLLMFYKYAPRLKVPLRSIWFPALLAAGMLQVVSKGIIIYVNNFTRFNTLYGTLGGVVVLLMWIYLSGSVIIFCGCLSAANGQLCMNRQSPDTGDNPANRNPKEIQ